MTVKKLKVMHVIARASLRSETKFLCQNLSKVNLFSSLLAGFNIFQMFKAQMTFE